MSEVGELRHEVVKEDGTGFPLLHVYLPEGLAFSEVAVTTGSSPGIAEVFIEQVATERALGLIELQGYTVAQENSVVKLSKKHRRYVIRLSQVAPEVSAGAEPPADPGMAGETTAALAGETAAAPSLVPPATTNNIFGLLDNDDISDNDGDGCGEDAIGGGKKKRKKKKKGKGAGAGGVGQGDAEVRDALTANGKHTDGARGVEAGGDSSGNENEFTTAGSEEGAAGVVKKKRKKGAAGASSAPVEADVSLEVGGNEAKVEEEVLPGCLSPPPPPFPPQPAASLLVARGTLSASTPAPSTGPAPSSKSAPPAAAAVDLVGDFGEEKVGSFEVGTAVPHDPLLGPAVFHSLGKVQVKGEDRWLEAPSNSWVAKGLEGVATSVSAFGIFDGHGGRMAAQQTAKQLLPLVARFAERAVGPVAPSSPDQLAAEGYIAKDEDGDLERARVAAAQDSLIARLPKALHAAFVKCDEDLITRHKTSGTTATLAMQVGWELLVANVGDSLAYLDTGSEVVVISANHRVSESTDEQERILKAGGRIKPAKYGKDDDPVDGSADSATPYEGQQLRVWPGGINMTRTIGDEVAKGLLIAEPAVRQISLPVTGARLIIASDGLWDAVNAKTIIGQLRTCNAREAASKAAMYAMRSKKHDDDVTVVVADFVPRQSDTHVPGLLKRTSGPAAVAMAALAAAGLKEERAAQSWRPLQTPSESWKERHRAHRRRAAAYLRQLEVAANAEVEAAEELERQQRMAVAPAAGTAGVGTAVRLPPVSDTYRELAELKVSLDALEDMNDDWTQVDAKKKKDGGSGFDLQKELMKAARPGEARRPGPPGGGGGREQRREAGGRRERREPAGPDRQCRPSRLERDGAVAATADATKAPAAASAADDKSKQEMEQQHQPDQQQPRGERRERGDRRDRGGIGGRGRGGAAGGGRSGGPPAAVEAAQPGSGAIGPAPSAHPGVVKAGGYLFVPRSLLTGGGGTASVAATHAGASSSDGGGESHGNPRGVRGTRGGMWSRRGNVALAIAVQASADGSERAGEQEQATADEGQVHATSRRTLQRRQQRERDKEAAAAAVVAAMGGLLLSSVGAVQAEPAALTAPLQAHAHVPTTSSCDPVVVLEPASGHNQRRQQRPYGVSHPAQHLAQQPTQAPQEVAAVAVQRSSPQRAPGGQAAAASPPSSGPRQVAAHYPPAQQRQQARPRSHPQAPQQPLHQGLQHAVQQQPQPQRGVSVAALPPAVPTYAGPLDFGAGFGPGSGMWAPSGGGGQYGGDSSANAVPQRTPGLAVGAPQRSSEEVATAAAAAAAAAVARKAAAAARGGRGGGLYAQGRT